MSVLTVSGRAVDLRKPLLMGVVNATPDSFSDLPGGADVTMCTALATQLIADGADWIDVGGESGITTVQPVSEQVESDRVVPVIEGLMGAVTGSVLISVDTWKPSVAAAAITAGASVINDVSGLADPELADIAAATGSGLVIMHTRAAPKKKEFPQYGDVVEDVIGFLHERIELAVGRGVSEHQIILDPGPDFAKTPAQTVAVLRALPRLATLGRPLLLAVSRKDFVGALTQTGPRDRLAGTLAAIGAGLDGGANILRVHDVAAVRDFVAVHRALSGSSAVDPSLALSAELRRVAAR